MKNDIFLVEEIKYDHFPRTDDEYWWCNAHERQATYIFTQTINGIETRRESCCNPQLGGILLPCNCVKISIKSKELSY